MNPPGVLVAVLASATLICVIGLASAQLAERIWRERPALAVPSAVFGASLVMWVDFVITWLAPPAGPYVAHFVAGIAIVYCAARRSWRLLPPAAPIALATAGIALTYLGLMYLWRTDAANFLLAATRFVANRTQMPVDNVIPNLLAIRISLGESTHGLAGDWNGSDRPPLQSGWILLNDALFSRFGLDGDALPFAAGFVAQLLWIPAVHALLRAIGVGNRGSLIAILFTAATGTLLFNTTYTWPKVLSAALTCLSMAVLIDAARSRSGTVLAAALSAGLFAFAMLAHGAAALTVPAVGALGILALQRQSTWTKTFAAVSAASVAIATYAPWVAFQRFYDPPGDRLLKWHLAGVIPIDSRSLSEALVDSYSRISLADYLAARWENLKTVVNLDLGVGLGVYSEAGIGERRAHEFFDTSIALGLGMPLLLLMGLVFLLHRIQVGDLLPFWRATGWLVALMLTCILFWCVVLFRGGTTTVNAGSHLWILVLLAVPAAWLASTRPRLAAAAWLTQLGLTLAVYVPFFGVSSLDMAGMATLCAGLLIMAATAWWALRGFDDSQPGIVGAHRFAS